MSKRAACLASYEGACRRATPDGMTLVPAAEAGRRLAQHRDANKAAREAEVHMHRIGASAYWRAVVSALWDVAMEDANEMGGAA